MINQIAKLNNTLFFQFMTQKEMSLGGIIMKSIELNFHVIRGFLWSPPD